MKKLLFIVSVFLISLSAKAQTTLDEYNYVTKGLRTTFEQGLDIKKGYYFAHEQTFKNPNYEIHLYQFNRETDQSTACLFALIKSKDRNDYLCIPHLLSNREIIDKANKDLYNKLDQEASIILIFALSKYITELKEVPKQKAD